MCRSYLIFFCNYIVISPVHSLQNEKRTIFALQKKTSWFEQHKNNLTVTVSTRSVYSQLSHMHLIFYEVFNSLDDPIASYLVL